MIAGNWLDFAIIFFFLIFVVWKLKTTRFLYTVIEFISFLFAIVCGLALYLPISGLIQQVLPLSIGIINVISLCTVMIVVDICINKILLITHAEQVKGPEVSWEKYALPITSLLEAKVILAFFFAIITALPISRTIKDQISNSKIANLLLRETQEIEIAITESFGKASDDTLNFFTIRPLKDMTPVSVLPFMKSEDNPRSIDKLVPNEDEEIEMFTLVNTSRAKYSLPQLTYRPELVPIARAYAIDMWQRKYFGHISPEGKSVIDRLKKENISFKLVGENLAMSSSVVTAEIGLINSDEHRENILDKDYTHIGVGVIQNGVHGSIYIQIFTR